MNKTSINLMKVVVSCIIPQLLFGLSARCWGAAPREGLVAEYLFAGSAADTSGNGNAGTVVGPVFVGDRFGRPNNALSFDGTDDYVLVGDPVPGLLQVQNEITLSAWINISGLPVNAGPLNDDMWLIVGSQHDQSAAGASIFVDGRPFTGPIGSIHFQIGDGSWHTSNSTTLIPLNQWVHIAATRKANEDPKIYFNGVLQGVTNLPWTGAISYADAAFAMGEQKDAKRFFKGSMDDVRVYDRALSELEVASLYHDYHTLNVSSFTAAPNVGSRNLHVIFVCRASTTAPKSIMQYMWDVDGDGTFDSTTASGDLTHTYGENGTYHPRVRVVDSSGDIADAATDVVIKGGTELFGVVESVLIGDTAKLVEVKLRIYNTGNVPAGPFKIGFAIGDAMGSAMPFFTKSVVGLGARQSTVVQVNRTFSQPISGRQVFMRIDSQRDVAEIDETNNGSQVGIRPLVTR